MFKNPTLLILGFIMFINALAYGAIVPLFYPYAAKYGLDPLGLSLLFVSFSVAQFIATPILGRLSDRFGRKPVLLLCLLGTSISLAVFGAAQSILVLFVSRTVDGITGGNQSVAQAVVADSVKPEDRAKAFGMLWGAFGFGFLIGPALGGLVGQFSLSAPFYFASVLALIGTIAGFFMLKETVTPAQRKIVNNEPLINLPALVKALVSPVTGLVLAISFIAALGLNAFIFGFQTVSNDFLKMSTTQVGLLLAMFGFVTVVMQMGGLQVLLKKIPSKKRIVSASFIASAVLLFITALTRNPLSYAFMLFLFAIFSAPANPVIAGLLSERTRPEDQGGMMGINQSYISLGQIFGPLAAGFVATSISLPGTFVLASVLYGAGAIATYWLYRPVKAPVDI